MCMKVLACFIKYLGSFEYIQKSAEIVLLKYARILKYTGNCYLQSFKFSVEKILDVK
jgi:hypothetical protein